MLLQTAIVSLFITTILTNNESSYNSNNKNNNLNSLYYLNFLNNVYF